MSDIQAVLFDLDGVIVSTDHLHYLAWKELADELGLPFDEKQNEGCRGVSRMESLDVVLGPASPRFSAEEKLRLATRKNERYRAMLPQLSAADRLPGVDTTLESLRQAGVSTAIGSSSRNAGVILEYIGLDDAFEVVVSGADISRSKPYPDVFIIAAARLGVANASCLVVEDAQAGIAAAKDAGMLALAVGPEVLPGADHHLPDLTSFRLEDFLPAAST